MKYREAGVMSKLNRFSSSSKLEEEKQRGGKKRGGLTFDLHGFPIIDIIWT